MVAQWNSLVKLTTRYQEKVRFFVKKQKIGVRQHQNAGVSQNWPKINGIERIIPYYWPYP